MNDEDKPFAARNGRESLAAEGDRLELQHLELKGLGVQALDVAPQRAEHIRRRAHAILRAEQAAPRVGSFAYHYQRSLEPALLIGLGLCQAIWAAHGTWSLLH